MASRIAHRLVDSEMSSIPTRKTKCATCPFRDDSPYADLRNELTISALSESSRICHSTGVNALYTTRKPEQLCRGARDQQLQVLHAMGFLSEATDDAWDAKCREMGLPTPTQHEKTKSTARTRTRSKT